MVETPVLLVSLRRDVDEALKGVAVGSQTWKWLMEATVTIAELRRREERRA